MQNVNFRQILVILLILIIITGCAKQMAESPNQAPLFFEIPAQSARGSDGEFPPLGLDQYVQDETPASRMTWSTTTSGPLQAYVDSVHILHVTIPAGTEISQTITIHVKDEEGLESSQDVRFATFNMEAAEVFASDGTVEIHREFASSARAVVYYGYTAQDLSRHVRVLNGSGAEHIIPLKAVQANMIYFYRWEMLNANGDILENSPVDSFRTSQVTSPPLFRMTSIDVRQGDSHLMRTPNGKTILIDGGYGTNEPSFGQGAGNSWDGDGVPLCLNYLRSQQISHLDAIVETHHHGDHTGGLYDVTGSSSGISNDLYISPSQRQGLKADSLWDIGDPDVTVKVFNIGYPEGFDDGNENNKSIVLKWSYGSVDFLTTGDAEQPVQARMIQQFGSQLRCEVLKIDHHGSYNGTNEAWITAISPIYAVIPVGSGNPYGHPHSDCTDVLYNHHVEILRTDYFGTIDIVTDGVNVIEAWY